MRKVWWIPAIAFVGLASIGITVVVAASGGQSAAQKGDWICTGIADALRGTRASAAEDQPVAGEDPTRHAELVQRGLKDLDEGIAWADAGCDVSKPGGTIGPSLYHDAVTNGTRIQISK